MKTPQYFSISSIQSFDEIKKSKLKAPSVFFPFLRNFGAKIQFKRQFCYCFCKYLVLKCDSDVF